MGDDSGNKMCYVGKAPCGCYLYASVIDPQLRAETASDLAKMIRRGWTVEQKTVQWVRDGGLNFNCPHRPQKRKRRMV